MPARQNRAFHRAELGNWNYERSGRRPKIVGQGDRQMTADEPTNSVSR